MSEETVPSMVTQSKKSINLGTILMGLGTLALLVSLVLPWATMSLLDRTLSMSGYEIRAGMINGGIGVLILIGMVISKGKASKMSSKLGIALALLAGFVILWQIDRQINLVGLALGVFVNLLGVALTLVGSLLGFRSS